MDIEGLKKDFSSDNYDMAAVVDMLEQCYEAAGFSDFYERVLSKMGDEELFAYFIDTFGDNADFQELLAEVTK